jgi:sugar-specific transcriptional regulator TrmB
LVINLRNVKKYLIRELKLSDEESESFLFIIKNGKSNLEKIAESSKCSKNKVFDTLESLVEKGMIINISAEYESLHPKFAIVNRYRRLCQNDNLPFKKNLLIDSLGTVLQRPFEDARTK